MFTRKLTMAYTIFPRHVILSHVHYSYVFLTYIFYFTYHSKRMVAVNSYSKDMCARELMFENESTVTCI